MQNKNRLWSAGVAMALAFAIPAVAMADGHCAATKVRSLTTREDGRVLLSLNSASAESPPGDAVNTNFRYKQICDIDNDLNGITLATCQKWTDLLTAAYLSGRNVVVWYTGAASGACSTASTWGDLSAVVTHITLGNY